MGVLIIYHMLNSCLNYVLNILFTAYNCLTVILKSKHIAIHECFDARGIFIINEKSTNKRTFVINF
jgi:hypothetical protein